MTIDMHIMQEEKKGFTIIELLVVVSIIGLIASIVFVAVGGGRDKSMATRAAADARALKIATELYANDVGFHPPDVGRGADSGFTKALPYNDDSQSPGGQYDCNVDFSRCSNLAASQPHLPANWDEIVLQRWRGPYLLWPESTIWNGEYDYNYWSAETNRYGCTVPAGVYVGVQGDYSNSNTIPASAEQILLDEGHDADGCLNGEAQMILIKL